MVLGSALSNVLTVLLGFLWPAYGTYKAIECNKADLLREWCMYWVIMAAFSTVTWIGDVLIFWLPLYYELKVLLVVALWHPRSKGAVELYQRLLHPMLRQHEARIDQTLEESKARILDGVSRQVNKGKELISSNATNILEQMRNFSEGHAKAAAGRAVDMAFEGGKKGR